MKRLLVLSSVLLLGGVVGCVGQDDCAGALRADVMAVRERQRASRERDTEQRVQALNEQLTEPGEMQGRRPT